MKYVSFVLLVTLFNYSFSQSYGRIVSIHDGDTYRIELIDNQEIIKVRLFGIDTTELKQDFGIVVRDTCRSRYLKQLVKVRHDHSDRYGRYVCELYLGEVSINETLIKEGYAWNYYRYSKSKYWEELQQKAKRLKIGLWYNSNAVAPSEYRTKNKLRKLND